MFPRPRVLWGAPKACRWLVGFLLEDVGDNLEKIYGPEWSGVKRGMSAMQWNKLIKSVKKLHSLGVEHGDLEPRNVAQTTEGFKFLILDGRDCIIVSKMSAGSWKICWMCTFLENNYRAKINVRSGNTAWVPSSTSNHGYPLSCQYSGAFDIFSSPTSAAPRGDIFDFNCGILRPKFLPSRKASSLLPTIP